jgi:Fuc2NAc and GlcNAc transferase
MLFMIGNVFFLSLLLTRLYLRYALAKNIIDIPNHRSSHVRPTPRGGGLAFVAVFLVSLLVLVYAHLMSLRDTVVLFGSGSGIAVLGFMDDRHPISAHWRFLVHFIVSLLAVWGLGGLPEMTFFSQSVSVWIINGLAVIYLVWMLNLYNFMDGIDGIAGMEAVSVCLGMAYIYWCCGEPALMSLPLLLAASVSGFLCWNVPPARVFMGDAGSGFLGIVLGVFSIQAAWVNLLFFWSWLILLGVFIVDATLTLVCRLCRGHPIHEAHRTHAYQKMAIFYGRHLPVTVIVCLITVLWLFPLSLMVSLEYLTVLYGLLMAYLPLIIIALWVRVGRD